MIDTLWPDTVYALHLRAPSVSGGKDWVVSVTTQNQIHSFWGKTDQICQHAERPGTLTELKKLIQDKCAQGYREIDEFRPGSGWQSQARGGDSPSAFSDPHPVIEPQTLPQELLQDSTASIRWDF